MVHVKHIRIRRRLGLLAEGDMDGALISHLILDLREHTAAIRFLAESNMALVAAMAEADNEEDGTGTQTLDND